MKKTICKICCKSVTAKNGLQCKGACEKWAHFKCLNYSPDKIKDIKAGNIKVNCPCPNCNTGAVHKEVVLKERPQKKNACPSPKKLACECDTVKECPKKPQVKDDCTPAPQDPCVEKVKPPPKKKQPAVPCYAPCCDCGAQKMVKSSLPCKSSIQACYTTDSDSSFENLKTPPPDKTGDSIQENNTNIQAVYSTDSEQSCENDGEGNLDPDVQQTQDTNSDHYEQGDETNNEPAVYTSQEFDNDVNSIEDNADAITSLRVSRSDVAKNVKISAEEPSRYPSDTTLYTSVHKDKDKTKILLAMDDMCETVGLFHQQIKELMGKMKVALDGQEKI